MVDLILACAIVSIFIIPGFIPFISYRIKKLREPYPQSIRNYKQIVEIVIDGLFGGIFGVIFGSIFEYIYIRVLFLSDISSEFTYAIIDSAAQGILIGGSLGGVVTYYIVRKTDAWPSRVYLAIGVLDYRRWLLFYHSSWRYSELLEFSSFSCFRSYFLVFRANSTLHLTREARRSDIV